MCVNCLRRDKEIPGNNPGTQYIGSRTQNLITSQMLLPLSHWKVRENHLKENQLDSADLNL